MTHELKIWPEYFDDVASGKKTFEVRKLDRPFGTGDELWLREWSPSQGYSGRETRKIVTYVMTGGQWGLAEGNCIMGIKDETPSPSTGEADAEIAEIVELFYKEFPLPKSHWPANQKFDYESGKKGFIRGYRLAKGYSGEDFKIVQSTNKDERCPKHGVVYDYFNSKKVCPLCD